MALKDAGRPEPNYLERYLVLIPDWHRAHVPIQKLKSVIYIYNEISA